MPQIYEWEGDRIDFCKKCFYNTENTLVKELANYFGHSNIEDAKIMHMDYSKANKLGYKSECWECLKILTSEDN